MACRIIYENLITDASMVTLSSQRSGIVTSALKDGTGSAVITVGGVYTGVEDKEIVAEIDSIAAGQEVAQATFKWSDGGGSYDATGVATAATNVSLGSEGLVARWTAGSGDDFDLGDKWYWKALQPFGAAKAIDWDRASKMRTAALESPNTFVVDLGAATAVKGIAILDHNIGSGATITIEGHTADSWAAPAFSQSLTRAAGKMLAFFSATQTYRYWRLSVSDAANADGYIEMSELILFGDYFEPDRMFKWDYSRELEALLEGDRTPFGRRRSRFFGWARPFGYEFDASDDDVDDWETMLDAIGDRDAGTLQPVLWVPDTDAPSDCYLVDVERIDWRRRRSDHNALRLELREVPQC